MSKLENFKVARWVKGLNRSLQIILCLTLWLAFNYVAVVQFIREDITRSDKYSLSQETLKFIEKIADPVTIYVASPNEKPTSEEKLYLDYIRNLLREYEYSSRINGQKKINVVFVNIYQDHELAQLLVQKYNVDPYTNHAIVVASGDNYREISKAELYKVDEDGTQHFKGEQVFTSSILNVSNSEKRKVYWLIGHGEMDMNDVSPQRGLSLAAQTLRQNNLEQATLDLSKSPEVPEDADLVIIAAPQTILVPFEVEKLKRYLSNQSGRLMLFLQPGFVHGLDELLWEWGILSDDMVVVVSQEAVNPGGDIVIQDFNNHSITETLTQFGSGVRVMTGVSRPVREDPGAPFDERLNASPLMSTATASYAERNYLKQPFQFNPQYDLPGPISIGMVAERTVDSNLGLNIPGGRLIVYGNADFIANRRFNAWGNKTLFERSVSWILGESNFLSIPPQTIEQYQLPLTQGDLTQLLFLLLILPGGTIVLGITITLLRRS